MKNIKENDKKIKKILYLPSTNQSSSYDVILKKKEEDPIMINNPKEWKYSIINNQALMDLVKGSQELAKLGFNVSSFSASSGDVVFTFKDEENREVVWNSRISTVDGRSKMIDSVVSSCVLVGIDSEKFWKLSTLLGINFIELDQIKKKEKLFTNFLMYKYKIMNEEKPSQIREKQKNGKIDISAVIQDGNYDQPEKKKGKKGKHCCVRFIVIYVDKETKRQISEILFYVIVSYSDGTY